MVKRGDGSCVSKMKQKHANGETQEPSPRFTGERQALRCAS